MYSVHVEGCHDCARDLVALCTDLEVAKARLRSLDSQGEVYEWQVDSYASYDRRIIYVGRYKEDSFEVEYRERITK